MPYRWLTASAVIAGACLATPAVADQSAATVPPGPSVSTCIGCHGVLGAGSETGGPRLAGQNPEYLAHALSMFKARTRGSDIMQSVAQGLSDSQIQRLALYFSQQRPPLVQAAHAPSPTLVRAGEQLVQVGAGAGLPACFSCHAAGGKGNGARFPSIAGQPQPFVVARLHEFQARAKGKVPPAGSMTAVASQLNESQIQSAAAYLSVIHP